MVCSQCGKEFNPKIKTKWFETEPEDGYIQCPHCNYKHPLKDIKFLKLFKIIFTLVAILIADIPIFLFDDNSWIKWLLVLMILMCSLSVYKFLCIKIYFLFAKK